MPTTDPKVEAWLNSLRRHLRGLKPEDIDEIVAELSSHIGDRVADGPETTLARLGRPRNSPPNTSQTTSSPELRSLDPLSGSSKA